MLIEPASKVSVLVDVILMAVNAAPNETSPAPNKGEVLASIFPVWDEIQLLLEIFVIIM